MTVRGTVLSVDRRHQLLVLQYGPLETAPGGIVSCALENRRFLVRLHRGFRIDALARTDRHPWLLRNTRILSQPQAEPLSVASLVHAPRSTRRS